MKANEAPEIIHTSLVSDRIRKKKPNSDEYDEYIRTDAFIEKALKFIKTNVDRIVNNQHGVCMGCMDREFKNYMKGE